jgi:hypothetical protein
MVNVKEENKNKQSKIIKQETEILANQQKQQFENITHTISVLTNRINNDTISI